MYLSNRIRQGTLSDVTDQGYFADDSMIRRVHRERIVGVLYGQRALLIGAMHPVAYLGTRLHTRHLNSPHSRLAYTAELFEAVTLGTQDEADRALAITGAKHKKVRGELPEPTGPYPTGTPSSADQADLML